MSEQTKNESQPATSKRITVDELAAFCKRKGFIFQSSEIYGGFAAVYDYGHYGALLKNNIQELWVRDMLSNEEILLLDSGIFTHPTTWKASGHVDSFADPQIDCRTCKNRMKVDHLLEKFDITDADRMPIDEVNQHIAKLKAENKLKCDRCGGNDLTDAKSFNLLVKSNLGSPTDDLTEENVTYLRGETCQGIYLNYKNYLNSLRAQLPFGIAQVGKAFRNEIVARQYIFRTREFEQMEMQYFLHPSQMDEKFEYWKAARMSWYQDIIGIDPAKLRFLKHEKLAHYASAAYDIQYNFNCLGDFKEIEGIHQRGDWDLSRHQQFSGENLEYFDQERNEKYIPHIMETSCGLNRLTLMVIDNAYTEETLQDGTTRILLKLKPSLAPVKAAVFPLMKKEQLQPIAKKLFKELSMAGILSEYDESGSIGKRYRRQDEIGTPFCITIDFDTLQDGAVTIRDRDTLEQVRVKLTDVKVWIQSKI